MVLEKTLESPLDNKEIQPVHPKGDQSWIFIGRTNTEAETPILWQPNVKNWLIWKDLMMGKIEGRRRGWQKMRWLECITNSKDMCLCKLEVGDGQGGLVCYSSWGRKESDTTDQLNWTELNDFSGGSFLNNPPPNAGDTSGRDSIPRSGRSPGVGNGNPFLYSCLKISMDRGI